MKSSDSKVKKVIEAAFTHCWELLDPMIFDSLSGPVIDRIEGIIKTDQLYTKY